MTPRSPVGRLWRQPSPVTPVPAPVFAMVLTSVLASGVGCAVSVEGDFDGVPFSPTTTAVALLDQHDVLQRDGAFIPVEKSRAQLSVSLMLTSADVPAGEEWRRLAPERYLDVKAALAQSDVLVLTNIDFDTLQDADDVLHADNSAAAALSDTPASLGTGDFDFALGTRADVDDVTLGAGLGALVAVDIQGRSLQRNEDDGSGQLVADITVTRERGVGQPEADVRTGEVTLRLSLPLAPERLTKANLAIVAPIARCKAAAGPDAGAACSDAPADPVVDATGVH